jgi:hypothetical protein
VIAKQIIGITLAVLTLGWSSVAFGAGPVGRPGQTLTGVKIDGQHVSLTISGLVDPAKDVGGYNTDTQGNIPQNDDHFITAELKVKNKGNSTISTGTLSVVAYDQHGTAFSNTGNDDNVVQDAYQNLECASGNAIGGNPNLSSLLPGEVFTYCLALILPDKDDVTKIEVSGIAGSGSGYNEWAFIDTFRGWSN